MATIPIGSDIRTEPDVPEPKRITRKIIDLRPLARKQKEQDFQQAERQSGQPNIFEPIVGRKRDK